MTDLCKLRNVVEKVRTKPLWDNSCHERDLLAAYDTAVGLLREARHSVVDRLASVEYALREARLPSDLGGDCLKVSHADRDLLARIDQLCGSDETGEG